MEMIFFLFVDVIVLLLIFFQSIMVRYHSRVAVLLCLLLFLHEFGPAHFANIKPLSDKALDEADEEPGQGRYGRYNFDGRQLKSTDKPSVNE